MLAASPSIADPDTGAGIARRTADAYHALPPGRPERTAIMAQSYVLAAYIDGYSAQHRTPQAYSSNRGYGYFPPPGDELDAVLYVGSSADELRPHFAAVRTVVDGGTGASVWLFTGPRERWATLWPRLRALHVAAAP